MGNGIPSLMGISESGMVRTGMADRPGGCANLRGNRLTTQTLVGALRTVWAHAGWGPFPEGRATRAEGADISDDTDCGVKKEVEEREEIDYIIYS